MGSPGLIGDTIDEKDMPLYIIEGDMAAYTLEARTYNQKLSQILLMWPCDIVHFSTGIDSIQCLGAQCYDLCDV